MTTPRSIPSIDQLRRRERVRALEAQYGTEAVVAALRDAADSLRERLRAGAPAAADQAEAASSIEADAGLLLSERLAPSLRSVINATGVIVHTNLGRAPLARTAVERVAAIASGYSNLEYDLARGARGGRDTHAERLICSLTGAEAAVVVNNNAAAVLLTLAALAAGREVIISRGELVEIGGGFRVPDVMKQSGATLREVGTTNRTRAADYAAAISARTALILRVHPSNFRIEGFTERPALADLVEIGRAHDVPVMEDLGSGYLDDRLPPVAGEPGVTATVRDGAAVVCFSGDKLLGGPQAGIVAGRAELVGRIRRHPLMRALRVDKMTYAALEATLQAYATGRATEIPVARMIGAAAGEIDARARALARELPPAFSAEIVDGASTIGGGSAPGSALPTRLLALVHRSLSADALETRLRALDPPVIARIDKDCVVLDLRTVLPEQDALLAAALRGLS